MARKPNEYHLVVFDPGGTIGWAEFVVNFKAFSRPEHKVLRYLESWDCGEFTGAEHEQIQKACDLVHNNRFGKGVQLVSRTDVVSEDFDLTQLIGGKDLLSPVRINAVLAWECATRLSTPFHLQARQMRTSMTPERLRLFGFEGRWTKTGKGKDMFAAMQHGIVWLRRIKEQSRSRPWKLEDGISTNAYWDCNCRGNQYVIGKKAKCDLNHS